MNTFRNFIVISSAVVIAISSGYFFQTNIAQAATPFRVLIYTHTQDSNVGSAYINSYNSFANVPGVTVVQRDITGLSLNQYQSLLRQDMISGQNLLIYGGHGSLSDLSTDGVSFTRDYAMRAASNIAAEKGGQVTGVVESCGSGNVCSVPDLAGSGNLDGVFTAANPGDYGWVFNNGGPWYAKFGEQFKSTLSHFKDGDPLNPDTNGDGVLTEGELAKALYGDNAANRSQIKDPNKPFAFKNDEIASKYLKYTECVILRPGQVDNTYSPGSSEANGVKTEYKPSSISGYEERTKDLATFPILGTVRDTVTTEESQINFDLRRLGSDFIEKHVQQVLDSQKTTGITRRIILLPTKAKAEEFVQSLGGNANAQGTYTLDGIKVDAGRRYLANNPSPADKITFDNECNPREWKPVEPSFTPLPNTPPNNGGNNGGGNSGTTPQQGSGLDSLLPLLLQSLLGQQGKQGQNQGNQNSNNGNNTQASCSQYGVSPVCGSDGKTYTNACWLQQMGQVQVSNGVCPTASTSPSPTPDVGKIIAQLVAAGVPQSVIDSIVKSLTFVVGKTTSADVVVQ